jgi:quinol monooxygenase YgiN
MIERHITFSVIPEKTGEFEQFFADEYRPAKSKSAGFVKVDLLCEAEHPERYHMIQRFTDADAATGWRISEAHVALQPKLKTLHTGMEIIAYRVVG